MDNDADKLAAGVAYTEYISKQSDIFSLFTEIIDLLKSKESMSNSGSQNVNISKNDIRVLSGSTNEKLFDYIFNKYMTYVFPKIREYKEYVNITDDETTLKV